MELKTKKCFKCQEIKLLSEFYLRNGSKDGYRNECKTCAKKRTQEWKKINPESSRESSRKWRAANPEKAKESTRAWQAANPERVEKNRVEYYKKNRKYYAEYEKKRWQSKQRKQKAREYKKIGCFRNPEKFKARYLSYRAFQKEELLPKPCEKCGASKTEMHHPDYSKPLEVVWLCWECHLKIHGKQKIK